MKNSFTTITYQAAGMSILVLRGHPALSRCYGRLCSSCLGHPQQPGFKEPFRIVAARHRRPYVDWRNIEHPEWRKEAVRRFKTRDSDGSNLESFAPDPRTKDGIMQPENYSTKPVFPPISLDRLPDVNQDDLLEARRDLNSTRPAPLDPVERNPDESRFKYYYRLGKAFIKFYKTGVKNIYANFKEYNEIKSWLTPFTIEASARYGGTSHTNEKNETLPIPHISRREFMLYYRTRHDLLKLLPFGLILLICGEFTPLVILLLGNRVTPYTCRIPSQQRASYDDTLQRFRTYQREMRRLTKISVSSPKHALDFQTPSRKQEHPWRRDALFAHLVGQTKFSTLPFPLTANLYWHAILSRRLVKYWDRIFADTLLIRREGGFEKLSPQDIFEYALHYGSFTLLVIMQREIKLKKNYYFINDSLKARLVPVLEAEADAMFDEDFTRLPPGTHWARAFRDSKRWGKHTPDVSAALKLMQEWGMQWGTGMEEWGGAWKFADSVATGKKTKTISEGVRAPDVEEASRSTADDGTTEKATEKQPPVVPAPVSSPAVQAVHQPTQEHSQRPPLAPSPAPAPLGDTRTRLAHDPPAETTPSAAHLRSHPPPNTQEPDPKQAQAARP